MSNHTRCPECNARLDLPNRLALWDHWFCGTCGVELEIITLNPLGLEVIVDLDEDDFEEAADEDSEALGWDLE